MLILSRHIGRSIFIGDDITVTVLEINTKQVKLGINANRDIPVFREEIYRQIQKNKHQQTNIKCQREFDLLKVAKA